MNAFKTNRIHPTLKSWFAGSKVRQTVYHATAADFEEFDTSRGDLGAHFGTMDQANHIAASRLGGQEGVRIIPVWLNLKNPLRLKDVGSFHSDGIARQLESKHLLPKGEGKRIEQECDANWRLRKTYDPMLISLIREAGYDGVIYANTQEGTGDSYIAFDSNQIKSVICGHCIIDDEIDVPIVVDRERCRS